MTWESTLTRGLAAAILSLVLLSMGSAGGAESEEQEMSDAEPRNLALLFI